MADTILAGLNTYNVCICASTTGAAGSETPDGNQIYLLAEKWSPSLKSGIKRKPTVNGASGYPSGVRDLQIMISNCRVKADVQANSTLEKGAIDDFLYDYSMKAGASKAYLMLYNTANSAWEKLSWNSGGTHVQYLQGYALNWKWESTFGKIYRLTQLQFGEVTI